MQFHFRSRDLSHKTLLHVNADPNLAFDLGYLVDFLMNIFKNGPYIAAYDVVWYSSIVVLIELHMQVSVSFKAFLVSGSVCRAG